MKKKRANSKTKNQSKAVILIVVIFAVFITMCNNNNKKVETESASEENTKETVTTIEAPDLIKIEGLGDLQSLFLQIDSSYSKGQIEAMAEANGLKFEERAYTGIGNYLHIATSENIGYSKGEAHRPIFNTASIEIFLHEDDFKERAFSKTYRDSNDVSIIEYTFYDDSLEYFDSNTNETVYTTLEDSQWENLEEAFKSVLGKE